MAADQSYGLRSYNQLKLHGNASGSLERMVLDSDHIRREKKLLDQGFPKLRGAYIVDTTPKKDEKLLSGSLHGANQINSDVSPSWRSHMEELLKIETMANEEEKFALKKI